MEPVHRFSAERIHDLLPGGWMQRQEMHKMVIPGMYLWKKTSLFKHKRNTELLYKREGKCSCKMKECYVQCRHVWPQVARLQLSPESWDTPPLLLQTALREKLSRSLSTKKYPEPGMVPISATLHFRTWRFGNDDSAMLGSRAFRTKAKILKRTPPKPPLPNPESRT